MEKMNRWAAHNIKQIIELTDRLRDPVQTVRYEEKQRPDLFTHYPINGLDIPYLITPLRLTKRSSQKPSTDNSNKPNIRQKEVAKKFAY